MSSWWCLSLACPPELEESLLWQLDRLGVSRAAVLFAPGTPETRELVAWLPGDDWPASERCCLEQALAALAPPFGLVLPPVRWQEQEEEDWSLTWKRHWQPDPVGQRLLILPAWLELPSEHADRLVIRIDPGSAFGTGSHPTTRLCLEGLEALALERGGSLAGLRVADLGCGSGILSLAALRLGAALVWGCDTDPLAIRATRENAALNQLESRMRVVQGSAGALQTLLNGECVDLLLCNILAPVIEELCPSFASLLARSGTGLLSGLLGDQQAGLEQALEKAGWSTRGHGLQGPWALLRIHGGADVS